MNTAKLRYQFVVRNMRMIRTCPHLFRHVTPQDMIREFDPADLAQAATHQERTQITGDLLVLGIRNFSIDASVEQQIAVSSAIQVICTACARADTEVDHALRAHPRFKETLIFTPVFHEWLKTRGSDIAHYFIYTVAAPEIVGQRYAEAINLLKELELGKQKLDTIPPLTDSFAFFKARRREF